MRLVFATLAVLLCVAVGALAQPASGPVQALLQQHREAIEKSSRKTVEPAIAALQGSSLPGAQTVLEKWEAKDLWVRKADGLFVYAAPDSDALALIDIDSGAALGRLPKSEVAQLKPNSGVRGLIAASRRAGASPDALTQELEAAYG